MKIIISAAKRNGLRSTSSIRVHAKQEKAVSKGTRTVFEIDKSIPTSLNFYPARLVVQAFELKCAASLHGHY